MAQKSDLSSECLQNPTSFSCHLVLDDCFDSCLNDCLLNDCLLNDCLIVGLGNPGAKYRNNRHNIGFVIVDELARVLQLEFVDSPKFKAQIAQYKKIFLLKPQTFMNNSGEAVALVVNFYKIKNIIVIHDEIDIGFGAIRLKIGGSSGGHNGLKSIDLALGRSDYMRVRFGVGKGKDVISYVLGDFTKDEQERLGELIHTSVEAVLFYLKSGDFQKTQNNFTIKAPKPQNLATQSHTKNPPSPISHKSQLSPTLSAKLKQQAQQARQILQNPQTLQATQTAQSPKTTQTQPNQPNPTNTHANGANKDT